MIKYFLITTFYIKLYKFSVKHKLFFLTDYTEYILEKYNVYINKNKNIIDLIILGDWFFEEYEKNYKHLHNSKRYFVLFKLYPCRNTSKRNLRVLAQNKKYTIFYKNNHTCQCCGSKENLTIDHIIPISVGGDSSYYNLQTLCNRCNSLKGNENISNAELFNLIANEKSKIKINTLELFNI